MTPQAPFTLATDDDARRAPVRLVVVQGDRRPPVAADDEPQVMTVPHLLVREGIALVALSLGLALLAIFVDAPLEEIANPRKTPNPAKAPWYFLGLQELLHYYPPLVSGVLLPSLVVIALVVIPYFDVNLRRPSFRAGKDRRPLAWLWAIVAALSAVFLFTGSHPVWPVVVPLWLIALAMSAPAALPGPNGATGWLAERSLAFWIFIWFLLASATLTVIGVAFRGPGWAFTLPWRDGLF